MVCYHPRWNSPRVKPEQMFSKPNPPCSPLQALPSGQNKGQWIWSLLWRQAQRQEAQGLKGTDRPSSSVMQCHASIKTHLVPTVKQSRGTWRNIFISGWFLVSGAVRSASSCLQTFGVEQLPASWGVATWLCVCMTSQKQKFCDKLDWNLLWPTHADNCKFGGDGLLMQCDENHLRRALFYDPCW